MRRSPRRSEPLARSTPLAATLRGTKPPLGGAESKSSNESSQRSIVKTRGHSRLHSWLLHSFLLHSLLLHTSRCAAGYTAGFQPRQPASRSTQTKKIAERKSHQVKKKSHQKNRGKKFASGQITARDARHLQAPDTIAGLYDVVSVMSPISMQGPPQSTPLRPRSSSSSAISSCLH